jgi:hypothetical protein
MNSDEIYKTIGYIVVIFFGLYVVIRSVRFQTNLVVEGFSNSKKTAIATTNLCAANTKKPDPEVIKNEITYATQMNKTLSGLNCESLAESVDFNDSGVIEAVNTMFDAAITNRKLLAIENSLGVAIPKMNTDKPIADDPAFKTLVLCVENVKAMEETKKYYNELFGTMV